MKKKQEEHPPAFQLYANDFSSSATVEAMSTTAVGAYMLLLCKAWHQDPVGSVPENDDILSKWSRVSRREWEKIRESVLAAFVLIDGRWHQKRMQAEWAKLLERRKERQQSGSRGAKKRWLDDGNGIAEPSRSNSKRKQKPIADDASSTSSSSSSSTPSSIGKSDSVGPQSGPAQPGDETAVLTFPVSGKPYTWDLTRGKVREFHETFPHLDIVAECRQALQWCKENRGRQKTYRGMGAFLLNWLSRSQNSGRGRATNGSAPGSSSDPRGNQAARDSFLESHGIDPNEPPAPESDVPGADE